MYSSFSNAMRERTPRAAAQSARRAVGPPALPAVNLDERPGQRGRPSMSITRACVSRILTLLAIVCGESELKTTNWSGCRTSRMPEPGGARARARQLFRELFEHVRAGLVVGEGEERRKSCGRDSGRAPCRSRAPRSAARGSPRRTRAACASAPAASNCKRRLRVTVLYLTSSECVMQTSPSRGRAVGFQLWLWLPSFL